MRLSSGPPTVPGSFCSAPPGAQRASTIGAEKATNPLLRADTEDAFVQALTGSLGSFPPYFLRLAEVNRRGPAVRDADPALPGLEVAQVRSLLAEGAQVIDVRPVTEFAAGHIPEALSIPLRAVFASWLGWLANPERPLIVVRGPEQGAAEIAWQAVKIGYTNTVGELAGGLDAWIADEREITATRLVRADEIDQEHVLDVRQDPEFAAGHVPGATHVELGALTEHAEALPSASTVVMCGHGERAMSGASLLEQAGHRDLAVLEGGPDDWSQATGRPLECGA